MIYVASAVGSVEDCPLATFHSLIEAVAFGKSFIRKFGTEVSIRPLNRPGRSRLSTCSDT